MTAAPPAARRRPQLLRRVFAGDTRVWITAAAVGLPLLAVMLFELLQPQERFTGTNSVVSRSIVANVEPGRRLCVPDLLIPAGTGRVRLQGFSGGRAVLLRSDVTVGGRRFAGATRTAPQGPIQSIELSIPERPESPEAAPGSVCVAADRGTVEVGGMAGLPGDQRSPTLGGEEIGSRVAVFYLPPAGQESSLLSAAGDAFERAALFRPGLLGPWFYALLMFAVLPLTLFYAVRLMATAAEGAAPGWLAIGAVGFVCAASWALLTPAFDAPDESEHFAYAQYLAETGNAPERSPGPKSAYSQEQVAALESMRHFSHIESGEGRPPWLEADERRWRERDAAGLRRDDGGGYTISASAHQPPYYALLAPAYYAGTLGSPWSELTLERLVSVLLGALAAIFAYLTALELLPRRPVAAVAAGLLVALHPMFAFMSGAVNNDMGVNASAAALVYLLVRGLRRGLSVRLGLGIGALLVAMPLLKGTGYALYPAAALALAVMLWRARPGLRVKPAAALAPFAAVAVALVAVEAIWLALTPVFDRTAFATPGGEAPLSSGGVAGGALERPHTYLSYVWQFFLPKLPFQNELQLQSWPAFDVYVERGWAAFGWYAKLFPHWVYVVIVSVMLAVGALALRALWIGRDLARSLWAEIAVLLAAAAGVILAVHAVYFTPTPRAIPAEQGRYAFTAMVPLALLAVAGTFGLGRRWMPVLATALVVATAVLTYASRWLGLEGFFA